MGAGDLFRRNAIGGVPDRGGLGLGTSQCIGLSLAAAFRHGFGEVGEEDGKPEPESDLEIEAERGLVDGEVTNEIERGDDAAQLNHEHDGVLHHGAGIEFGECVDESAADDLCVEEILCGSAACHVVFLSCLEGFASLHEEVLEDGTERECGKERECADDENDSYEQHGEERRVHGEGSG